MPNIRISQGVICFILTRYENASVSIQGIIISLQMHQMCNDHNIILCGLRNHIIRVVLLKAAILKEMSLLPIKHPSNDPSARAHGQTEILFLMHA